MVAVPLNRVAQPGGRPADDHGVPMARRFHFTLEPVQSLRLHAEREAMRQLSLELDQQAALALERVTVEQRLDDARRDSAAVTAAELDGRQRYVERVERELAALDAQREAQRQRVEAARRNLGEARRQRETLDRLEEQRRAAHELEGRREERTAADELSLQVYLRTGDAAA